MPQRAVCLHLNMLPPTVHNYSYTFRVEDEFQFEDRLKWMKQNWTYSLYYAAIYAIVIFGIKRFMRNRQAFELRKPLIIWNVGLAAFSFMGAMRVIPESMTILNYDGLYYTICGLAPRSDVEKFWWWMMALSKVVELGDTALIVLRKKPLIFLHWYHHMCVLIYSWFSSSQVPSTARLFILMNFSVHAIMYSYYALMAMKFRLPKKIAMVITILQITQMALGCYINVKAWQYINSGLECHTTSSNVVISLMLYASHFYLFAKLFHNVYFSKNKKQLSSAKTK